MTTVELLKLFGLTNYEAEVYGALLKVERAKVKDLVKMVSVPRPMIYLTLKKLMNNGMCSENRGKISHYSAVAPSIVLRDILQNEKEMFKIKERGLQELNRVYKEPGEVPFELIQVLKGKQMREVLNEKVNEAEKEMLIFFKHPAWKGDEGKKATQLESKALKRGIKIRCLYEKECFNTPPVDGFLPFIRRLINQGEEGRVIEHLPMNLMILDEKVAFFSLLHQMENDVTVFLFSHPALISTLKAGFEFFWAKGLDIKQTLNIKR